MKFTELELKYIRDNYKKQVPREIADHLGIAASRVRTQIDLFEEEERTSKTPIQTPVIVDPNEQKERPAVMGGMKSKDVDGVLVMTPAASERGDEFRKTFRPAKFDEFTRKIYRESK